MSTPDRTSYTGPPLSGPGLIYTTSHITSPELTTETFNKWYDEHHILDVLATGIASHAARWTCNDPSAVDGYLATYQVPDLSKLQGEAFAKVPMTHELLPGGKEGRVVQESVDFDTGVYGLVETFEKGENDKAFSSAIISAGMTPSTSTAEADMESWYVDEHNEQMSLEAGWLRSTRYKLLHQYNSIDPMTGQSRRPEMPVWMTLHEFRAPKDLGEKVVPLVPITDWTRKVMGDMKSIVAFNWTKRSGWTV